MSSFIKLSRKITKWGWYTDGNTFRVFMHLLLNANWKDGEYMGQKIPAGSLPTGYAALAKQLNISVKNARTAIKHLKSTNEVTVIVASKFSIITLTNWELYQSRETEAASKTASKRQAGGKQAAPLKEGKKVEGKNKARPIDAKEVEDYGLTIDYHIDGNAFIDNYETNGWVRGKAQLPIKDWKACVRTWKKNGFNQAPPQQQSFNSAHEILGKRG